MSSPLTMVHPRWLKRASALLGLFAFAAGAAALGGWVFNIPRLTDWFNQCNPIRRFSLLQRARQCFF
jgi:hypothetical protein